MKKGEGKFIHPVITPAMEQALIEQAHQTLSIYDRSGIFAEFEDAFAAYHHKKHGLVTNSGTTALWSLYDAIGLEKGDEVICPIYTFHATVNPILQTGATPVFVDCDQTGNIDPQKIAAKITPRTKAIMVTHMWGYACKMDEIQALAKKHNLLLLEDASHAHGGSYQGKKLGSFGDAAAFSLQGNKIITGGEGGILLTDSDEIYRRAVLLGHYGKRTKQELDPQSADYQFAVTGKGLKLRAHPLAIRLAYEQFKNLDQINAQKNQYSDLISNYVAQTDSVTMHQGYPDSINSGYAQILQVDETKLACSLAEFCQALNAEGATEFDIPNSTAPLNTLALYQNPGHFYPDYQDQTLIKESFPVAQKLSKCILKMPLWYTEKDAPLVAKYGEALTKVAHAYEK